MGAGQGALHAEAAAGYQMLLPASASESTSTMATQALPDALPGTSPITAATVTYLLTRGWGRGAAIFNQVEGRA